MGNRHGNRQLAIEDVARSEQQRSAAMFERYCSISSLSTVCPFTILVRPRLVDNPFFYFPDMNPANELFLVLPLGRATEVDIYNFANAAPYTDVPSWLLRLRRRYLGSPVPSTQSSLPSSLTSTAYSETATDPAMPEINWN